MPDPPSNEFHRWRTERIILGEFELGSKYTTFKWRALGTLDQGFPVEHVIFRDWACGDSLGWVCGEILVLVEETFLSDRSAHFETLVGVVLSESDALRGM